MPFTKDETAALLAVKGVGATVIQRFEEIGIDSFAVLKTYQAEDITHMVASMLGTSCWKNSPQAKAAITAAIERAKEGV